VSVRVIADLVALCGDFAEKLRVLLGVFTDHEECGVCFVTVEEIEEFGSDRGVGAVVEGDG